MTLHGGTAGVCKAWLVQAFPVYILQGKHFGSSLGKPIFADEEVSDLAAMYGHSALSQSMDDFMRKVRIAVPARRHSSNGELS